MCKRPKARENTMHPRSFLSLELLKCRKPGGRQEAAQAQLELALYPGGTEGSLKVLNRGLPSGGSEEKGWGWTALETRHIRTWWKKTPKDLIDPFQKAALGANTCLPGVWERVSESWGRGLETLQQVRWLRPRPG